MTPAPEAETAASAGEQPSAARAEAAASALVCGPILRGVGEGSAVVWVEAARPCEVTVRAGAAESSSPTFAIEGHHYAILALESLAPDRDHPYEVLVDGERVWPEAGSEFPAPTIRPARGENAVRIAFGSCRVSRPHVPPHALARERHSEGHGVDALRAFALRAAGQAPEELPDCLLMLGDQIYADELSPAMERMAAARADAGEEAGEQLTGFEEYASAYREAWSEPAIRWLMSTVPVAMVFDDHDVRAEWKISQRWLQRMRAKDSYAHQVPDGLMAYWVYQHLGNLPAAELAENDLLGRVRAAGGDAGPILREEMTDADRQHGHSRWSYRRDLGRTRLVVIDSRAGRELEPGRRRLIGREEWEWVIDSCRGDYDHLLLASSVPFFLTPGLHHAEAWNEAVCEGAWGGAAAALGERIREGAVMDHWASFQRSFGEFEELLQSIVTGGCGTPPKSVVLLSGDVHHCYLAEVGFPRGTGTNTPVWQAVCSGLRKELERKEDLAIRFGNSRAGELLARALAGLAGAPSPRLGWRIATDPAYENQIASLDADRDGARIRLEACEEDWARPRLRTLFERELR